MRCCVDVISSGFNSLITEAARILLRRTAVDVGVVRLIVGFTKQDNTLLQKYPDIGETIESFVQDHQVGADAW